MTSEMNSMLTTPFVNEEIVEAIKQMQTCKAPKPNGIHTISIMQGISIPRQVNKTNIVLIPKVKPPTQISDLDQLAYAIF